uniref:Uncharacterized protein n=1 Tax=Lactuca sativa TaxID=4236 RepID=A0A9R1W172_LACSA|nr:hypothetical protein LSAT_V11C400170740 [Lactuca sativa]
MVLFSLKFSTLSYKGKVLMRLSKGQFRNLWLIRIGTKSKSNSDYSRLLSRLKEIDHEINVGNSSDNIILERLSILAKSLDAAQKAYVSWLVEGDENSAFFSRNVKEI